MYKQKKATRSSQCIVNQAETFQTIFYCTSVKCRWRSNIFFLSISLYKKLFAFIFIHRAINSFLSLPLWSLYYTIRNNGNNRGEPDASFLCLRRSWRALPFSGCKKEIERYLLERGSECAFIRPKTGVVNARCKNRRRHIIGIFFWFEESGNGIITESLCADDTIWVVFLFYININRYIYLKYLDLRG